LLWWEPLPPTILNSCWRHRLVCVIILVIPTYIYLKTNNSTIAIDNVKSAEIKTLHMIFFLDLRRKTTGYDRCEGGRESKGVQRNRLSSSPQRASTHTPSTFSRRFSVCAPRVLTRRESVTNRWRSATIGHHRPPSATFDDQPVAATTCPSEEATMAAAKPEDCLVRRATTVRAR